VFCKAINENPEKYFTDEIMAQLEVAANAEFLYGQDDVEDKKVEEVVDA
jgi:hypothetical protein